MLSSRALAAVAAAILVSGLPAAGVEPPPGRVHAAKITILSTMLADNGELGEWGFSALVVADGHPILFDTGMHSDVVLKNARGLGIDLASVPEVVLSHNHHDHVGGLMTLRRAAMQGAPAALGRAHVGLGIFYPRVGPIPGVDANTMTLIRAQYEATGGVFVEHSGPVQLHPGVWLTGPVPRKYPERNWSGSGRLRGPAGTVEDDVPEDMSLVLDTDRGLIVVTGCGHAGIANIVDYSRTVVRPARIHAIIGGVHLFEAQDSTVKWTADRLGESGLDYFMGAHCTGIETVYSFRRLLSLDRAHAVVGAVGASFELGRGIDPGNIAQ